MMKTGKHVQYRVREIKRYIVTRYSFESHDNDEVSAENSRQIGSEYASYETAHAVGYAMAAKEHGELGYDLDDERIQYPKTTEAQNCVKAHETLTDPAF